MIRNLPAVGKNLHNHYTTQFIVELENYKDFERFNTNLTEESFNEYLAKGTGILSYYRAIQFLMVSSINKKMGFNDWPDLQILFEADSVPLEIYSGKGMVIRVLFYKAESKIKWIN